MLLHAYPLMEASLDFCSWWCIEQGFIDRNKGLLTEKMSVQADAFEYVPPKCGLIHTEKSMHPAADHLCMARSEMMHKLK